MPLEVIGAGFGRTGTNSLRLALERLGFGPCHHMHEVAAHPEQTKVWLAAAEGTAVDWEEAFAGYRSQMDWPGARYWRELAEVFPDARVILTVRPVEAWLRSFLATIGPEIMSPPLAPAGAAAERRRMQRLTIADQVFGGRPLDPQHAAAVYEAHLAEVQATIAPERLLVYDVRQGWAPLCAFLGVAPPDAPFPRTNDVREFHDRRWIAPATD